MKRRQFLKTSLAASTFAGLGSAALPALAADPSGRNQEYYELRTYHLKNMGGRELLDNYLHKAAIPALNRLGSRPVGVLKSVVVTVDPLRREI